MVKTLGAAFFALLGGTIARSEPVDCERLKSSQEPYQLIRVTRVNGAIDADHVAVYREAAGRSVAVVTRANGSSASRTTNQGMFAIEGSASGNGVAGKVEYSGIDPKSFPLERSATYTMTQPAPNGQKISFKVEYTYIGRKTVLLDTCQIDVVQYSSRRFNLLDGKEVSFFEGEYSPELQSTISQKGRVVAQGNETSIVVTARQVNLGVKNFALIGGAAAQPATAQAQEFSLSSLWKYSQVPVVPGRIFAHRQADIVDRSGAQLGGVAFYCAVPHSYVDIFVHRPGAGLDKYFWGEATLKTGLKLNGVSMPANVERGIVYIDIGDGIRPALEKAFEPGSGARAQRVNVDVANFAKFDLVVSSAGSTPGGSGTERISFGHMMDLCDATIAAQGRGGQ
jgi:hypothetical protein